MASSQSLESMLMCTKPENEHQLQQEKKPKPADEQALKCPRCDSANTKFCYYNNYSLTQPRYFCKSCRRYWTKGGTLRNVPVGGGCRKNKRSSSLSKRNTPDYQLQPDHHHPLMASHGSCYDHSNITPIPLALAASGTSNNISVLGGAAAHGNSSFDLFGGGYPSGNSFLDTLRGGLIECNNNHYLYYGLDSSGGDHSVNVSHEDSHHHEVGMRFEDCNNGHYQHQEIMSSNHSSGSSTPRVKQEMGENRMLWGFPWQFNGEGNYMMNGGNQEINSAVKENWNTAIVGSTWNNLINSPLM